MLKPSKNMNGNRCFVYVRKSSESEDRQVLSLESQSGVLKDLAKRYEMNVVKEFTEAKSAKEPGRQVFNEMIEAIKRGEAENIVCWKLDRLTRNPVDQGTIQHLLQKGIIQRITTPDREYLPGDNVLMMGVEMGMANQFILDLRKNVMRGNKTKLEKGGLPGRPPIGYLNDPDKTIIPDPARFPLVQKLLRLFLTGAYTPRQLVTIASDEIGLTKPGKHVTKKGFDKSYIYKVLRNPFYCGVIVRAGERYAGSHERMINPVEHEEILRLLKRQKSESSTKTEPKTLFPLTGMIRCGCGRMITAYVVKKSNGKRYRYYSCTRKICHDEQKCSEPIVRADDLEEQAYELVKSVSLPKPLAAWIKAWAKLGHMHESFITELEVEGLHKEKERIIKRQHNLTAYLLDNVITREEYGKEKPMLVSELQRVQGRLEANMTRIKDWEEAVCCVVDLAALAKEVYEDKGDVEGKKIILQAIGSNFVLKDKKLNVEVKKPFQVIANNKIVLSLEDEKDLTQEIRLLETKNPTAVPSSLSWCSQDDLNVRPLPSQGSALSS